MSNATKIEKLALILQGLTDEEFKGEVRINYRNGKPKHCHIHFYIDLDEIEIDAIIEQFQGKDIIRVSE